MKIFRGDTFEFDFQIDLTDGSQYEFQVEEILRIGMKRNVNEKKYTCFKEIKIEKSAHILTVIFENEEMEKVNEGKYILEIELTMTNGKVKTVLQENIEIVGDVINV